MKDFYDNMSDIFRDLMAEGYLYDEDENGRNMSYGEHIEIANFVNECLEDYLAYHAGCDFGEIIEAYENFANGDDDQMSWSMLPENIRSIIDFTWDDDDNLVWVCYGDEDEIPDALKKYWEQYKEEHEYAREYA